MRGKISGRSVKKQRDARTKARYHHGFSANSQSIDAAKELMQVLKSPTAIGVMRPQGMEPGK